MPSALDELFAAAAAFPAPVPGDSVVQAQISFEIITTTDQVIVGAGLWMYTSPQHNKAKDVTEPAYFVGTTFTDSISGDPGAFNTTLKLIAPEDRKLRGNYVLQVSSDVLTGNFVAQGLVQNGKYIVSVPEGVSVTVDTPTPIDF